MRCLHSDYLEAFTDQEPMVFRGTQSLSWYPLIMKKKLKAFSLKEVRNPWIHHMPNPKVRLHGKQERSVGSSQQHIDLQSGWSLRVHMKPAVVVQTFNLTTLEAEAGGSGGQSQP